MSESSIHPQPPFDSSAKSDVILRSSDNVDFYALKSLLTFSSPRFESIFSQPIELMKHDKGKKHRPIIELTEESKILQGFLPFFYPGVPPRVGDLDDIINIMAAGHKYSVDVVVNQMTQELLDSPIMIEDPFRMFALAFYHGWETVGQVAAKNTLAISISELKFSSELAYISGTEIYQLLQYRLQCIIAIRKNAERTRRLLNDLVKPGLNESLLRAQAISKEQPRMLEFGNSSYPLPWTHQCNLPSDQYRLAGSSLQEWQPPGDVMIDGLSISNLCSNSPKVQWWWVIYLRDLLKEVAARPRASTVLDDRLSDIAIKEAMKCSSCIQHVHREMSKFKRLFAEQIEEAVSTVLLDIDFPGSAFLEMGEGREI